MKQFFTLSAEPLAAQELATFETAFGQPSKAQMLEEYRAGTRHDVTFPARVYVDVPNKNYGHFDPTELAGFAASFTGKPFLKDHSRKLDDRGGTILESTLQERNGTKAIIQRIAAVEPWAVKGYLTGTVDRFSIGWYSEDALCTVCGDSFFGDDEKHTPWDIGKTDKKSGQTIGVLWKGIEGIETSAVNTPAVPGTGVDEVLSQFQQLMESASGASRPGANKGKEIGMLKQILSLLGLAADTAEPEALKILETRLSAPPKVPAGLLTALGLSAEASADEAIAKAYSMVPRSELEEAKSVAAQARAEELVRAGKAAGKITPVMEAWARGFATRDAAEFEKCLATLPVQIPVTPPAGIPTADPGVTKTISTDDEGGRLASGLSAEEWTAAKTRVSAQRPN